MVEVANVRWRGVEGIGGAEKVRGWEGEVEKEEGQRIGRGYRARPHVEN